MSTRRLRSRASLTAESSHAASSGRPRRGVATSASSATIERTSPEETRQSIHLTVKAPPSKLREATSGSVRNVSVNSRDRFQGGEILSGPRGSRNKKVIVEESSEEEDEEEDEEAEEPEEMDEDEEEDGEEAEEDDEDVDAEGEDDVEMEDAPPPPPPPPVAKSRGVARLIKPSINVTPAPDISGIEAKEVAMVNDDDDDEELSELESQDEEDEEDEEGGDEDAEGEDEEIVDDDADRDEDLDSDDETPQSISRSNTPDLSKLTRRQRAAFEEYDGGLIALSNGKLKFMMILLLRHFLLAHSRFCDELPN
jgi:Ino eighty subunit 2